MLIENPLNESGLAFPTLECIHIAGFICGIGTIALVDFRLLGIGLTTRSASQLWSDTMPWTLGGLSLAILSGLLLFSINPDVYYLNHVFVWKMVFLVAAILFNYTAVYKAAATGKRRQMVACVSLGLWAVVLFGGIFIRHIYPVVLALHIIALALFGGLVLVTDLRLLGIGMLGYSISDLVRGLRNLKRFGLVFATLCGLVLFSFGSAEYASDPWFRIKIALLALIIANYLIFRRSVYNNTVQTPGRAKLAGGISLLLWTGVACAARGPATIREIMHSMVDPSGDEVFQSVQEIADGRGIREKAPQSEAEWQDVRQHLMVLEEAPGLLTAPGRRAAHFMDRSRNPQVESQPEDVQRLLDADRPSFIRRATRLHDAAAVAVQAVDAKDKDGLFRAIDGIDKACENCHLHYWYPNDKRAQEAAKEDGITE